MIFNERNEIFSKINQLNKKYFIVPSGYTISSISTTGIGENTMVYFLRHNGEILSNDVSIRLLIHFLREWMDSDIVEGGADHRTQEERLRDELKLATQEALSRDHSIE